MALLSLMALKKREISQSEAKQVVAKAICQHVILWDEKTIPDRIFNMLISRVDANGIPDRELLLNKRVRESIDWNSLKSLKAVRIMIRDKATIDRFNLSRYDFKLSELIPLFLYHPDLVEYFDINFDDLTATEAINMLDVNRDFIEIIDLGKYKYDATETTRVIKKFATDDRIVSKLDLGSLDHFNIRSLLIKSGDKYIGRIDATKLKATDWVEILKKRPELLQYCNLSLFEKGDRYLLVKLAQMFPQLDYLIGENADKINAIGWEELLIHDHEKYSKHCDFSMLSKKNWENIIKKRPEMSPLKKKYVID
jgi:hypothetical protein